MKIKVKIFSLCLSVLLYGCKNIERISSGDNIPIDNVNTSRSVYLSFSDKPKKEFSETEYGGFITWKCKDFITSRKGIIFEVGYFMKDRLKLGFVLYDGTNSGEIGVYQRSGVNHQWYWGGKRAEKFVFVIKPNGDGVYYDITKFPNEEKVPPADIFRCKRDK